MVICNTIGDTDVVTLPSHKIFVMLKDIKYRYILHIPHNIYIYIDIYGYTIIFNQTEYFVTKAIDNKKIHCVNVHKYIRFQNY